MLITEDHAFGEAHESRKDKRNQHKELFEQYQK